MLLELLKLIVKTLFGSNLRPVKPPRLPSPEEVIEEAAADDEDSDMLDPVSPIPVEKTSPNILVPNPANADQHGPASSIARAMLRKGYAVFDKQDSDYNLNIVAIRTANPEFDRFRCRLAHFWKWRDEWHMESWPITTLPGHRYMVERLLNPRGCAILVPGQYRGVYKLARHRGVYEALCQRGGPVRVYRDGNRDRVYDMDPRTIQNGEFGINLHATENPDDGISRNLADRIGSASAGCLVNARVTDFVEARKQWRFAKTNWGEATTLTLLEEQDLDDIGTVPFESVAPQTYKKGDWNPPQPFTVGIRNRNLLNVKQGRDPWKFSTGKDAKGHAIFPDFASGLRAGLRLLRAYWVSHRLRTLSGICNRWAPTSDTIGSIAGNAQNDPNAYARFIAKRMGIEPNSTLMLFTDGGAIRSPDQLFALVSAMVAYENHVGVVLPRELFDAAVGLYDA